MTHNTLFLRLEGPLQAWGGHESKFVIRRTGDAPSKSGVIGMLCAALGISRKDAAKKWLPELSSLVMGVRIDRPGVRWWDYHTIGARMNMRTAEGKTKPGALLSRREYLCDASFLVALMGEPALINQLHTAMLNPQWALYLGRKSCPPSRPIMEHPTNSHDSILDALAAIPFQRRLKGENALTDIPDSLDCIIDWLPSDEQSEAPDDALIFYDIPVSFQPPAHKPRFVIEHKLALGENGDVQIAKEYAQNSARLPFRARANYRNSEYRKARLERLNSDNNLCVFCKSPATTVQHITYRRAGGNEDQKDLRSLCRLCHDAVTMIEYGQGMDIDRINPEDQEWRDLIIKKRAEIIAFRSLEIRRRRLKPEEVE